MTNRKTPGPGLIDSSKGGHLVQHVSTFPPKRKKKEPLHWLSYLFFLHFFPCALVFFNQKKRKEKKWGARHTSRTMDEIPSDEIVKNTQKKNSNELKFKYVMEIFPIWNKSKRPLWIRTCDKKWKKNRKVVRFCRNHNTFGYAMTKTR